MKAEDIYHTAKSSATYTEPMPGSFVKPLEIIQLFNLKEGFQFADFGAGTGAYVLAAAPLVGESGQIYAIDIQKEVLLRLKQIVTEAGHSNTKFLWCDFENSGATQLPDESLDVAVMSNTLFQLEDKSGALREIHRVLKSTGKFHLIDWSESFNGMGPEAPLVVTKENALNYATATGFALQEEFNPGEHHYGLTLIKK